ncbi:Ig-like domain-containing protein [Kaarinaea lacus]
MLNNQRFNKQGKAICFAACLSIVISCDNGIVGTGAMPDPVPTKEGIAQKGPFEIGSNITIITRPAPNYIATSNTQVQTLDDIGSFEFSFEPDTLYEITVTGRHFNEITGEMSQQPITLKSTYYRGTDSKSFVSVNILTHLIHSRINYLISNDGLNPRDATAQASQELIEELKGVIFADHLNDFSFSNMTVYNNHADSDPEANAVLLFISAAFYQQSTLYDNSRPLGEMLTTIADDLEQDGKIDGNKTPGTTVPSGDPSSNGPIYVSSLDFAARLLNPEAITNNLTAYSIEKTGTAIPVPDISFLLDNDADGITNDIDDDDDGDGITDANDQNPYQFEIIASQQTFTTTQDVAVNLNLQFNQPEHPDSNTVYLGIVDAPSHGVLNGVYPNLVYTPNAGFNGVDSFSYTVNCITCSAIYSGVYTSDTFDVTLNVLTP